MNHYFRSFGATRVVSLFITTSALILGLATPALAGAPVTPPPAPTGELLSSYGTDCGVLTISPENPGFGENITVSLTHAKPNSEILTHGAPGIYKNGRWYALFPGDNTADGKIQLREGSVSTLTLSTDSNGTAGVTGTIAELLSGKTGDAQNNFNFILTLLPFVLAIDCDSGTSFAQIRGARASLPGSLSLDPNVPEAIIGSGLPAGSALMGILVSMGDYPDPGVAAWQAYANQSAVLGGFSGTVDADGNLASTAAFTGLAPGRYALGIVAGSINTIVNGLAKAEYVVTVADGLSVTMELWTEPSVSGVGSTLLSLMGGLGEQVAGSDVKFSSIGLKPYTDWSLTLRSTPQVLTHGTAGVSGILSGSVALPSGLEAGWHSLTFTSTGALDTAGDTMYWFRVGAAGELLEVSATDPVAEVIAAPAMLAATGADASGAMALITGLLIAGLGLMLVTRRQRA